MKIIVAVRTLNEEKNIDRFCLSYAWADKILIADGGSKDGTIPCAFLYENVKIRPYEGRVETGEIITNPRGRHINFLFEWALEEQADWIIFDDMDCVPTWDLQQIGRSLLESCEQDLVLAYRLFVLGQDRWFPDMNRPGQSLWAWKSCVDVRADETNDLIFNMLIPTNFAERRLEPPMALLHYFYPDEETMNRKKRTYIATGEVPEGYDPMTQFGRIEALPDWARWK